MWSGTLDLTFLKICLRRNISSLPQTAASYSMVYKIMIPTDAHIPILGTGTYVNLHGKRDFAGVIKVMELECGDYPGSSR